MGLPLSVLLHHRRSHHFIPFCTRTQTHYSFFVHILANSGHYAFATVSLPTSQASYLHHLDDFLFLCQGARSLSLIPLAPLF